MRSVWFTGLSIASEHQLPPGNRVVSPGEERLTAVAADLDNLFAPRAIELAAREGAPGARGYEVFTKCFHDKDLLIRTTGDVVALSPPLILDRNHVDQIFARVSEAIRETA